MSTITLSMVKPNVSVIMSHLCDHCPKIFKKKLLAMGFVLGSSLKVIRTAPLGCPIEIDLQGSRLSLRKSEASCIFVNTP